MSTQPSSLISVTGLSDLHNNTCKFIDLVKEHFPRPPSSDGFRKVLVLKGARGPILDALEKEGKIELTRGDGWLVKSTEITFNVSMDFCLGPSTEPYFYVYPGGLPLDEYVSKEELREILSFQPSAV